MRPTRRRGLAVGLTDGADAPRDGAFLPAARQLLAMSLGISESIQLAASLIFAIPLGIFGLDTLLGGDTFLGGVALVVAVLMVVLPRLLTTPADIPAAAAEKAVGKAVKLPDEDDE